MEIWVGIDVSMETLDFGFESLGKKFHKKIPNTRKGFLEMLAAVPQDARFVMEATGTYYLNVALFLHEQGRYVSVANPCQVKNHMKSDLRRNKSDKSDSFAIARFGTEKQPARWRAITREQLQLQQLQGLYDRFTHQITQLKNEVHAFKTTDLVSELAVREAQSAIKNLTKRRAVVLHQMEAIAQATMPREVQILSSIPGVGLKTAIRIVAGIGDFKRFATSRKLVSFAGLSPTSQQSGTSVRSTGHISRMGGTRIRGALYMCAVVAKRYNSQCTAMWKRLKERGKHGKKIIIAIMCKLLKQMHTLVMKDELYNPNFLAQAA